MKYNVYGIGNALVDMDFEIDYELLNELKIDKGLMTLIDEDRQHELLQYLTDRKHVPACGGSAANTMIAQAQFGGSSFYSCKVANDHSGQFYFQDLMKQGVACNLTLDTLEPGHTGKCFVFVTPDADRTMNTYLGVTEHLSIKQLDEAALKQSEYLYMEGYIVTSETGRAAAIKAREIATQNNIKTSITLSDPNMTNFFKDGLEAMIGDSVDFLFCNIDEALSFTKTSRLADAIIALQKYAKCFSITRGGEGSLIFDGQKIIEIPAHKVAVKDTVGAGDMYAGALLYGITHGFDYTQAGHLASYASSQVVKKMGPRLTQSQTQDVLNQVAQLDVT